MPNCKTHDTISLLSIPLVSFIILLMDISVENSLMIICAYIFSCFLFSPDLDIDSRPYRRWLFFKWIWYPYQKIVKHRSIYSHGIIIGNVVRLIYISPIILSISYFFNINLIQTNTIYILIGLELGSIIHFLLDKFF